MTYVGRKRGRKPKYDPDVTPKLAMKYAMEGCNDAEIAKKLGINKATLYEWQNQYAEFHDSLKKGKEPVNAEIEMAMVKSATGYFVEEEKTEILLNPSTGGVESMKKTTNKRYIPPSAPIQKFIAQNRMPDKYQEVDRHELTGKDGSKLFPTIAELMMEDESESGQGEQGGQTEQVDTEHEEREGGL